MKTLKTIIQEKLNINSKTEIISLSKELAKYLNISENDAKILENKYLHLEYFELDDNTKKYLPASQFELVFLLASMLVNDNAGPDNISRIGTVGYRKDIGPSNPYDYSWYENEFSDDDNDYVDLLDYIKEQYIRNNNFKKLFKEVYKFCEHCGINDPEKIFEIYENIDLK